MRFCELDCHAVLQLSGYALKCEGNRRKERNAKKKEWKKMKIGKIGRNCRKEIRNRRMVSKKMKGDKKEERKEQKNESEKQGWEEGSETKEKL